MILIAKHVFSMALNMNPVQLAVQFGGLIEDTFRLAEHMALIDRGPLILPFTAESIVRLSIFYCIENPKGS